MKLALECRTEHLDMIQPFADFDWILVDKYLSDKKYAEHYRNSTNEKFVDNSVTEKGEPCSPKDLKAVFEDCRGSFVVSPDWINEKQKTIDAYREVISSEMFPTEKVVGVLQGATPEDALSCLDYYLGNLVLVPYRVGGSVKGESGNLMCLRRTLVVSNIPSNKFIHLLGFTSTSEFKWYANRSNVLSVDTDVPVRSGLVMQEMDEFDRKADVNKVKLDKENWAGVCRNIALLRKAMA
jgi:queuine/archaeosine tRNA-ribosyltransferase